MNSHKGFAPLLIVIIIALLLGGGAYVYTKDPGQNATVATTTAERATEASGWEMYNSTRFGVKFSYPSDFIIMERLRPENNYLGNISVSDSGGKVYFNIDVFTKPGEESKALFTGPFPKTTSGGRDSSPDTVVQKSLNGMQGIESYGRGGGGEGFHDDFVYLNGYLWVVHLNPVVEGRVTLSDALEIVGGAANESYYNYYHPDLDIYHTILQSLKITPPTQTSNSQTVGWENYLNTGGGSCVRINTKDFGDIYISNSNVSGEGYYAISYPPDAKIAVLDPNSFEAQTCGSPTGLGLNNVASNDTVNIGGKQYLASGFRDLDNSWSFMVLRTSFRDKINIIYGVAHYDESWNDLGPLTDVEYQTALNSAKAVVSTLR